MKYYKDEERRRAWQREWKRKNKDKVRAHQKKFTDKRDAAKYTNYMDILNSKDDSGKMEYLSALKGSTIKAIVSRVPSDEHEEYMHLWKTIRGGKIRKNKPKLSKEKREYLKQHRYMLKNKKYLDIIDVLLSLPNSDRLKYLGSIKGTSKPAIFARLSNDQQIEFKELFEKAVTYKKEEIRGKNIEYMVNHKKTHPCKHCGEDNYQKLSFHHIDESTKLRRRNGSGITMGDIARKKSFEVLKKEIEKCIVLCHNCHHIFHHYDYKLVLFDRIFSHTENKHKTKGQCKRFQEDKIKAQVELYKEGINCAKCNIAGSTVLVFHHIDSTTKVKKLSKLRSKPPIKRELKKCICFCRNCHEEYHMIYGRYDTNLKDAIHYLGRTPQTLSIDFDYYRPKFDEELKQSFHQ